MYLPSIHRPHDVVNAIRRVFKSRQCNALQGFPVPLSVLATLAKTPKAKLRTYATCDWDGTVNSNDTGIQVLRFGHHQSDINFTVSHKFSPYGYDQNYIKGLLAVRAQFLQSCATNPDRVAIAKELYRRSAAQMKQGLPSTANRVLGLSEMKGAIPDSAEVSAVQQRFKDLCTITQETHAVEAARAEEEARRSAALRSSGRIRRAPNLPMASEFI